jgi:S-DNA-T family DNA segregation ATPase FtsK/SpoIIIE
MAYRADDPAPLLPAAVKAWALGWLFRALGCAVLLACAATAASLISWTAIDPILARATGSAARNLMGAPGAIVSDVIMQMAGLAGMFALLPPLFWALHLVTTGRPPAALRLKVAMAPLAVLCLAAALSSLPVLNGSPLHHGYGGLIGDTGLVFVAGLLAKVNPERSWAAAGLFCFAGGTIVLMRSLGLTQQDLKAICRAPPGIRLAGAWRRGRALRLRREPLFVSPPPADDPIMREPPPFEAPRPAAGEPFAPRRGTSSWAAEADFADAGRGSAFDRVTDKSSEDIARRFAPGGTAAEPRLSQVAAEPPDQPPFVRATPEARHVEATWVRSSLGGLKRRQPVGGIARPSGHPAATHLCDLLESEAFRTFDAKLPLALGRDPSGAPAIADLAHMPNLLIAAGSNADVQGAVDAVVLSLVCRHAPERCRLLMLAPARPRPSLYDGLPHLVCPIAADAGEGIAALDWIAAEMDERFERMARLGVSSIDVYNNRVATGRRGADLAPLPHIVVVIGELAELMHRDRCRVENALQRLDRKARVAGIHLVAATQRPSPEVMTAIVKKAFPARLAGRLATAADSCAAIDAPGAEQLRSDGHMLCRNGGDRLVRLARAVVTEEEASAIIACQRGGGEVVRYV